MRQDTCENNKMSQVSRLMVLLAVTIGCGVQAGDTADFTPAEAEAARAALVEVLEATAKRAAALLPPQLELPPSISDEVRHVAFVKVETVKEMKNMSLSQMQTLRIEGALGTDPIANGRAATFTLPLALDQPHLTGDLVRKVNDVGPTGHFDTTLGVYRLEAAGVAELTRDSCSLNITAVTHTEVSGVDTTVEGASLLNRVLASDMSSAVRSGALPFREPVSRAVLSKLQEAAGQQDCTVALRNKLKAAAAPAA